MKILGIGNMNRMGEIFCSIFRDLGYDADFLIWHPGCRNAETLEPIKTKGKIKEFSLLKFLLKNRKKYDLFICHYALQSAILCNLLGVNYVCHVRGYDVTHSPNHPIYGRFLKRSFKKSKAMWCSTPVLVNYAKKYHKKVHFIPNIVRDDIYKPIKMEKNKRLKIFMPARQLWDNKGMDKAVKMFGQIQKKRDAELHFINWGEDKEKTKQLVKELKLKNVFWHELTQNQKEMNELYNSFDVVWDSFGYTGDRLNLVALEAMSCNRILIINKLEKGLYPGNLPMIQASSEEDVVKKTINFENFEDQRKKQREWIEKYFSYNAVKEKLKECLNGVE